MDSKQAAGRATSRIAWLLCGLTLTLIACTVAFTLRTGDVQEAIRLLALVASALVGGVVASRQPTNRVGWFLLISTTCFAVAYLAEEYVTYGQRIAPGLLPLARAMAWPPQWLWAPGAMLLLLFLPLYFPDGRLTSHRWRWVVRFALLFSVYISVAAAFQPGDGQELGFDNPLGVEGPPWLTQLHDAAILPLWLGFLLLAAASLVIRFHRAGIEQRQQIKLLAFAASAIPVWFIVSPLIWPRAPFLSHIVDTLALAGVPMAVGVAVLKYRLYDIDLIINRTLAYTVLTACVIGIYVLIVGYLGAVFNTRGNLGISLVATGVVAVLFQPLRDRIQRGVNRLLYGERDDPYRVLTRLGQRLEATLMPETVLITIIETVKEALKLPYAAITMSEGENAETLNGLTPLRLPLVYQSERVGELLVAPRGPGERFSPPEVRLLEDLARQAGVAVHAVRLTAELKQARTQLVTMREEERRRIRRDLHDGLGPALATLALGADTARDLIRCQPDMAEQLLAEVVTQAQAAIVDIRRLVYGLRPPALDEMGLVGALQALLSQQAGGKLLVHFEAPETVSPLSAAVEVATYRIVQEALTNVVRHADAQECTVRLSVEEAHLVVEVSDNGRGMLPHYRPGVGLHSMRERAEELGGTISIDSAPDIGTVIRAQLVLGGTER
jgi:signal transduction histidine kinase